MDETIVSPPRFQFSLRGMLVFVFAFALGFAAKNLISGLQPFSMQLSLPSSTSPVVPGDVLLIESVADEQLNRRVVVLADGTISLPLVGTIAIGGNDVAGVEKLLLSAYKKYYVQPSIQVYRAEASQPIK